MANIVISRIQNRRGRRENLPQPLLPAEVALTSDTSQAWIGQDPSLAVPSINVYSDRLESTAQTVADVNILETRFDENMTVTVFNTLVAELEVAGGVTLVADDILWDDTYRGVIESITGTIVAGTGYTTGDIVTAISATGSGFSATIVDDGGGGIQSVTITSGGSNYRQPNTTFSVATGTGGSVALAVDGSDIYGSSVHIAANPTIDSGNTVSNIGTTIDGLSVTITNRLMTTTPHNAFGAASGNTFVSGSLIVDNHIEAANVVTLMNRVNSTTPGENTGLVYTNLNIELTTNVNEPTTFQVAASDLVTALAIGTNKGYFRMPRSMEVSEVRASLISASTAGAVTIDINQNAVSILSTLLTIDQDEKTSVTAAVTAVLTSDPVVLADDDEITVDIDGAGSGALGLIVTLIGLA
jgi:hypothetical protein